MSEYLSLLAAVMFGIPGAIFRRAAWPLLASFGFLCFRYYGLELGYDPTVFAATDAVTFSTITVLVGTASSFDLRDVAILALFIPAAVIYGFVSDPVTTYWMLWLIGMCQFILAAPWEMIWRTDATRRMSWEG